MVARKLQYNASETASVSETSDSYSVRTGLIAREDFIVKVETNSDSELTALELQLGKCELLLWT
jgi:hypothetical protein